MQDKHDTHPFAFVETRSGRVTRKPRTVGISVVVDLGLPIPYQRSYLEMAADFIDYGKLFAGSPKIYAEGYLREKVAAYQEHNVRTFPGGAFIEYVLAQMGMSHAPRFFKAVKDSGFDLVEISDQFVPLTEDQRRTLANMATGEGLGLVLEVGSMANAVDNATLTEQIQSVLSMDPELVFLEGAEIFNKGNINHAIIEELKANSLGERVVFEIGGPHISGMKHADMHDIKKMLIREFGANVNLANIRPEDILDTETLRIGVGGTGPMIKGASSFAVKP